MSDLVLVSHPLCPYVQRAQILLTEKGVPHRRLDVDLADKPAWFRAISPLGKVPLLRVGEAVLFESAVIAEYLDETRPPRFLPEDPLERARHRGWVEFASSVLDTIAGLYNAPDAAAFAARREVLAGKLDWFERHLGEGPWFAGEGFGLVEAAWGPVFRYFDTLERLPELDLFAPAPRLAAYRRRLAARPSVAAAVAADYPERLLAFLLARGSHLSGLLGGARQAAA